MSGDGRVALVTGASGALGGAIASALARDGARVIAHHRRHAEVARALCAQIVAEGGWAEPVAFDTRDAKAVSDGIAAIAGAQGRLDIVVNSAGIVADAPFGVLDEQAWSDVIDTNLGGTYRVCRAAARVMLARREGVLVNVASVAALRGVPYQANYSAAKAGILGLSRTLARELGPKGIRVNTVIPGLIAAGMGARVDRRHAEAVIERVPLGHAGTPEDVAAAVVFLASPRARYITGAELTVDGGLST